MTTTAPAFDTLRAAFGVDEPSLGAPRLGALLAALLSEINWRGDPEFVREALPYFESDADITALRNALLVLGYRTSVRPGALHDAASASDLVLFEPADGGAVELIRRGPAGGFTRFQDDGFRQIDDADAERKGAVYLINRADMSAAERGDALGGWFSRAAAQFSASLRSLIVISLASNIFAIATPLFVMVVYDKVIGQGSGTSLPMLTVGVLIILGFDLAFRLAKARVLARVAGRFDHVLGVGVFQKLLRLPVSRTERASASAQIARLKEFEGVRDFFSGPLAGAFVELPFVVLLLLVIGVLGGPLVLAPVLAGAAFVSLALFWKQRSMEVERRLGQARSERQTLLVETILHRESVSRTGAEPTWRERFRQMTARECHLQRTLQRRAAILEGVSGLALNLAVLAILAFGALRVLDGSMTVGALIAVMALAWRVLAPIQTTALAFTKLKQIGGAIRQINQFFRLADEFHTVTDNLRPAARRGAVAFDRVSLRYEQMIDPALLGATFAIEPGELIAVTGENCSGKTSLFKLLLGLHAPQAGHVYVDGVDVRQLDPRKLRRAVAYAPQATNLFYGTIRQNVTFGHPTATDDMVAEAIRAVGLETFVSELPEWLDTRIGDDVTTRLPRGFARRLTIARAIARPSDILLLDQPEQSLDRDGEKMLIDLLTSLKGHKTIILITHRPCLMTLADRAVWLRSGMVEALGPPEAVLEKAGVTLMKGNGA